MPRDCFIFIFCIKLSIRFKLKVKNLFIYNSVIEDNERDKNQKQNLNPAQDSYT